MNESPKPVFQKPRFQLPAIGGRIERRILVNYRCDPATLGCIVPAPFRPKLVNGLGLAGICLIRLGGIKPAFLPGAFGFASENAAHRIAIEWDEQGRTREGVYIPRRDTNSTLNHLLGGNLFPGEHHTATFRTTETGGHYQLAMESRDGSTFVQINARATDQLPNDSVFRSLEEASRFFQNGALGWSARAGDLRFDGLELTCHEWRLTPLEVTFVSSSFFENRELFPVGKAIIDSAFLMQNIPHTWHARGTLAATA